MSSKSDRDNRSNQLNPNNSAFWSSRSGDAGSGDEDDDGAPSWAERQHRADLAALESARQERLAERGKSQPPTETLSVPGPTPEELAKLDLRSLFY